MIVVNWATSGDLWISTDVGVFHSSDFAASFYQILGFTTAFGVALGAPKVTGDYPAVFASGVYGGVTGYFRSDDAGVKCRFVFPLKQNVLAEALSGFQINDAAHGFGAISANVISGDPRVYGRIYIGTNGRGIFYGDIKRVSSTSALAPTTSSTTNAPASTSTANPWGQCGGQNWTGPTSCGSGWTCVHRNPYYYQCLQQ